MKAVYDLVLFDLDGTLTESGPGITSSLKDTLNKMQIAVPQDLHKFIGPPLFESFKKYCKMTDEQAKAGIAIYRDFYNETGVFNNSVYPGLMELLRQLREAGAKISVATSKPQPQADVVLNHFQIAPLLDYVSGAAADERSSTKAGLIKQAIAACKAEKSRTVMIGDTRFDAEGAKKAGVDFIGVLYGYGTQEEMENEGATCFANNVQELREILIR